jgi:hypothetical protein
MYFIIHYNANCFYPLQCKSKPLKLLLQISGGAILAVLKYKILISLYNTIWKHLFCIHVLYCIVLRFHVVTCCVVLCCVVLCCVVLCCVVLCCVVLCCVALRCVVLRCVALRCVVLCCVVLCCVALRCVALRCVALRCVVLCCVVLCCVVLCCIMLWCVVLSDCIVLSQSFSNYVSVMWSPLSPYCIVSKQIKPKTYI